MLTDLLAEVMNRSEKSRRVPLVGLAAVLLLAGCMPMPFSPMMGGAQRRAPRSFASPGEQIYFTATGADGRAIPFEMSGGGIPMMMGGAMACADCHGSDGRGGRVRMMMAMSTAPDIRYATLTAAEHGHRDNEENHTDEEPEHPPYTDETLRNAITRGVNPAGEPLAWPMPRWRLDDDDLTALIDFLKTLE